MKCSEIMEVIRETFPEDKALSWDHVGLLCGEEDQEVSKILVAVDVTEEIVESAVVKGCDMIISHHPMIFSPLYSVNAKDHTGRKLLKLIRNNICCFAMHTNYDTVRMAKLAGELLGLSDMEELCEDGIGVIGNLKDTAAGLCEKVKHTFGLSQVIFYGNTSTRIDKVAIVPGSGKSTIREALSKGAQVLITGDIGHHDGLDAKEMGLSIIDASHYGVEQIFVKDMGEYLAERVPGVEVLKEAVRIPYSII